MTRCHSHTHGARILAIAALCLSLAGCFGAGGGGLHGDEIGIAHQEHQFRVDEGSSKRSVSVYRAGTEGGRRLIFVHGTPGNAAMWKRYLTIPMDGNEVVALDRPGFGASRPLRAVTSLEAQARAIEPLLTESPSGEKPILIGHSMGGPIVARVASDYPDRVGALVIIAGSLDPDLERVHPAQYLGAVFPFSWLLPAPLRVANRELLSLKRELAELEKSLERVVCPVVIVHATDDSLVPYENVMFMQERFRNAASLEIMTLMAGDHFLPWNNEPTVREAITRAMIASNGAPPEHESESKRADSR